MPVSIPRLNRIEPQSDLPANDRINFQAQDQANLIQSRTNSLVSLGSKVGDIYQAYENDTIDTLSKKAEIEYTTWNNERLAKLKASEGDPVELYAQYEIEAKEKHDEILNANPEASERVKRYVSSKLNSVVETQRVGVLKQRGAQTETYDNNLYEATVSLKKDSLPVTAGYINKDDPSSTLMFDKNLEDIKTTIAKQSLKKGTAQQVEEGQPYNYAYQDEDGNVVRVNLSNIAKEKMGKELSEGVKNSIDVLIAGDQIAEAKMLQEKYKNYIDPLDHAKLKTKIKEYGEKENGYNFVRNLKGTPEEQLAKIESIKDPKLKEEVLKIKDTNDNRLENLRERQDRSNYDLLAKTVLERQNSDQPFYGVADLENDPIYKSTWDKLSAKSRKAVQEMVKAPKESNTKSQSKVQKLFMGGEPGKDISTISPEEFNREYLSGLNKSDRAKYTTMYNKMNIPSAGEKRAMYNEAGKILTNQLILSEYIEKDKYNKISGDDELKLIESQNELIDHLSNYPGVLNTKQLKDFAQEFAASKVKGRAFNPPVIKSNYRPTSSTSIPSESTSSLNLSPKELIDMKRQYRNQYGTFPSIEDEKFKNFVQSKMGR